MSFQSKIITGLALGSFAATAQAVTIYGLGTDARLYSFDSATPGTVTNIGPSAGLVDIDFHAANNLLYGVSSTGLAYTINTSNGAQTLVTTPLSSLSGLRAMDFNPVVDRIRLAGAGNSNFRLTPDFQTPGPVANGTVSTDGNFTPPGFSVLGVAYTNPFDGTATTTLFSVGDNGTAGALFSHSGAPTFNTLTQVGLLGFTPVGAGFDIDIAGNGYAYDGINLRQINLGTGVGTNLGAIGLPGGVSLDGLAVVIPEPSAALLGSLAGLALLRRRRNA